MHCHPTTISTHPTHPAPTHTHARVPLLGACVPLLQRMFRGDEVLFEEAFGYGCPKFITASPPAFDNPSAAAPQEVSATGMLAGVTVWVEAQHSVAHHITTQHNTFHCLVCC